jgi:beta-xylosidase
LARYNDLSQPCVVQYNFIGKFETLDADIALAFKYIRIDGIVKFPQRKTFYKKTKSSDISEQYFNEVPKYYLRKLWQHLKGDYLLFS